MKVHTNLITTFLFATIGNVVYGQDTTYIGDPDCGIKDEAACVEAAEIQGLTFVSGGGDGGHAWGCFVNENGEAKWDGKTANGKQCDGKKCKEKFDTIPEDWENKRLFCGGAPASTEEENPVEQYGLPPVMNPLRPTCFDYTMVFDIDPKKCTWHYLWDQIRLQYDEQSKMDWATMWHCAGGLHHELLRLTQTDTLDGPSGTKQALQNLCDDALVAATKEISTSSWDTFQTNDIDMEEFMQGGGFMNREKGNFRQYTSDFMKRAGYDRHDYIGEDARLNDYFPTTEQSYAGGEAVSQYYMGEARHTFLSTPTSNFESGCPATNSAVCCWSRDRQYYDNNGSCDFGRCAQSNPGDNTDLCFIESEGEVYPYPGDETENNLHCHGFAWGADEENRDVNQIAKWNNLFFVSMYDHMYQRGYVESITDDPKIAGEQAMCGCVEDMNPVARADCTEAIGRSNYTAYQDATTGLFTVKHKPESFEIEFKACEGYDYVDDLDSESYLVDFEGNAHKAGLQRQTNDLSAFVFRQYLEGKISKERTEKIEETIIGYKDPTVNDGDEQREVACKAAFEKRYPGQEWVERELVSEEEETA